MIDKGNFVMDVGGDDTAGDGREDVVHQVLHVRDFFKIQLDVFEKAGIFNSHCSLVGDSC